MVSAIYLFFAMNHLYIILTFGLFLMQPSSHNDSFSIQLEEGWEQTVTYNGLDFQFHFYIYDKNSEPHLINDAHLSILKDKKHVAWFGWDNEENKLSHSPLIRDSLLFSFSKTDENYFFQLNLQS